ncbi:hypothetical protein KDA_05840 [Dictyobacter alpinus]|uniref:Uncharacterized protein n=1 Tax=Dictyobacter alpinus TaxID=2014873 RepID=A0A402B164_9CHLR|nr:hypothetical protein [Dictyobacter alpinus]GCE25100.1 hypothetical protein KDA_05840 [Dictyobacter alpinus]
MQSNNPEQQKVTTGTTAATQPPRQPNRVKQSNSRLRLKQQQLSSQFPRAKRYRKSNAKLMAGKLQAGMPILPRISF